MPRALEGRPLVACALFLLTSLGTCWASGQLVRAHNGAQSRHVEVLEPKCPRRLAPFPLARLADLLCAVITAGLYSESSCEISSMPFRASGKQCAPC